ncbi:MAG TPA: hypothetical protein VK509_13885 [Polyangiales bacterium]|nr:hypothetical protein [Polyangiales bacterium]
MRERVLVAARAQLREVAVEVLAGALDVLETQAARTRMPADARRSIDRTREVLERDRALVSTLAPTEVAAAVSEPTAVPAVPIATDSAVACDEPIRTRSMAKLLAAQGYPHRALVIYRYLLAQTDSDEALRAEIAALQTHLRAHEHAAAASSAD